MTQTALFYNTTHLDGDELKGEVLRAKSLQELVHQFFQNNPKKGFVWSDVTTSLGVEFAQYGSVKRCLTNLMNDGKLYKSTNVKNSIFGKKAHFYFLVQ